MKHDFNVKLCTFFIRNNFECCHVVEIKRKLKRSQSNKRMDMEITLQTKNNNYCVCCGTHFFFKLWNTKRRIHRNDIKSRKIERAKFKQKQCSTELVIAMIFSLLYCFGFENDSQISQDHAIRMAYRICYYNSALRGRMREKKIHQNEQIQRTTLGTKD